jgi:hypothetical protein
MHYGNENSSPGDQYRRLQDAITDQFSRMAQETGGRCRAEETADGFEAALEYWTQGGEDDPSLRIAARFNEADTATNNNNKRGKT